MITICLTRFTDGPYVHVLMDAFYKALSAYKSKFKIFKKFGYPEAKYDLIVLIGIRSIVKRNLDPKRILPFCDKLIDMGDSSMDPRRNYEDLYFYFNPSTKKKYKHYIYLPKFLFEDYLFPEQKREKGLTVFVDHFKFQNPNEKEQSILAIEKIFESLRSTNQISKVFYHTSKGIEINRFFPEIPKGKTSQCALYLPYHEITKYYRQTDIFLPTHRETQGMVAQEIGACGGVTVLQPWMYPKSTHHQFPHIYYDEKKGIDFELVKNIFEKDTHLERSKKTLNISSFKNFQEVLYDSIMNLFQ